MPVVPGYRWQDARAEADLGPDEAADALRIAKGTLRNIETAQDYYVSLRVIHRAARLYGKDVHWLSGAEKPEEKKPTRPPSGDPKGPKERKNGKDDRRGPKRTAGGAAA